MGAMQASTLPESTCIENLPRFVFELLHDLREPLRTIRCYAELVTEKSKSIRDNDLNQLLTRITEAATRMQCLIDDTPVYATINSSPCELRLADLGDALRFAISNLETAVNESNAVITSDRLPSMTVHFGALARVFQNLISNAIKYRREESPRIHVGCFHTSTEWVFSVADNGIGIEPAYWQDVFLPLRRLHSRQEYPGSGLGLAICKRIIESHSGRIWLESKPTAGSKFFFTIPELEGPILKAMVSEL